MYVCMYVYIYIYIYIYNTCIHTLGFVGFDAGQNLIANEIGTPDPQLEPQITSLDKCNVISNLVETLIY